MAKYDLYLRLDDPSGQHDQARFAVNFFKGAFGLWLRLCLVIGLATTFSTYLSGIISALLTLFLFLGGLCLEFIQGLANKTNYVGGPLDSLIRLVTRENMVTPLEDSPAKAVATWYDEIFRWFLRRIFNLIPDVDRFDFSYRVSEGFAISLGDMAIHFLLLLAYLLPLALLAYHLIRSREVASA
jgi:hypothetical protein